MTHTSASGAVASEHASSNGQASTPRTAAQPTRTPVLTSHDMAALRDGATALHHLNWCMQFNEGRGAKSFPESARRLDNIRHRIEDRGALAVVPEPVVID